MVLLARHTAVVGILAFSVAAIAEAGEQRLTTDGRLKRDPRFTTNEAESLVYTVQESPALMRLMKLDLESKQSAPLHEDAAKSEFEPAFSPDGRCYAFVQSRGNLSLALVIRNVVDDETAEVPPAGGFSGVRSPAVSPDGTRVVYAWPEQGRQHLFSVDVQAKDRKQLTDSSGVNNWPHFSPDGRQIVFGSTRDGNYEIYTMQADGSHVRRLTNERFQDLRPRFSPDGKRIAFTSSRDGNYEIYVMQADGSNVTRVTEHPERDDYAEWHPNGEQLVIVSERRGRHDLFLVDVP